MNDPNLHQGKCCLAGRLKCLISALFRRERHAPQNPAGYLREKWPEFHKLFDNPELLVPGSYPNQSRVDTARLLTERTDISEKLKCTGNLGGTCSTSAPMMSKPKRKGKEQFRGGTCVDFCFCRTPVHVVETYS